MDAIDMGDCRDMAWGVGEGPAGIHEIVSREYAGCGEDTTDVGSGKERIGDG